MSEPVYVTSTPPEGPASPVLVVACSKDAYLGATREFLERHLGLAEGAYHLLAVPGGPQFLVVSEHLPKFAWAGHRWLRFAGERMGVTRVVLVAHEGCLWYEDERFVPALLHRLTHGGTTVEHQRDDLRRAAAALRGMGVGRTREHGSCLAFGPCLSSNKAARVRGGRNATCSLGGGPASRRPDGTRVVPPGQNPGSPAHALAC